MTMHGFSTGVFIDGVDGLVMRNNHLVDLAWDGIIGGNIHNAVFTGNSISLDIPAAKSTRTAFSSGTWGPTSPPITFGSRTTSSGRTTTRATASTWRTRSPTAGAARIPISATS